MDASEIERALDDVFDQALIFHAFTDYMRDYEMVLFGVADPRTGIPPSYLRYRFRYCVEARTETTVTPETWRVSLDDELVDHDPQVAYDGYVWGIRWHVMYPGGRLVRRSVPARRWERALGIPFHEVVIETNAHKVELVFSDLEVTPVAVGYVPFQVLDE
jgi:hypothetical protein